MSFIEWAGSEPLAILPEQLDVIRTTLDADVEALASRRGQRSEDDRLISVHSGGVVEIPIRGVISRYPSFWSWLLGGSSTEGISSALHKAIDDPAVKGIVLHVDSPGGQATGIVELANYIREASKVKPVHAFVEGYGASAAYWLATAAPDVTISPTAIVGSIGSMLQLDGRSNPNRLTFVSSQSPLKNADPKTDAGRAEIQRTLDALTEVFISDVARFRGVKPAKVVKDFGKGGTKVGADAVRSGMADRLGSFEDVLTRLRSDTKRNLHRMAPANRAETRGKTMNPFSILARLFESDPEAVQTAVAAESAAAPVVLPFAVAKPKATAETSKSVDEIKAELQAEFDKKLEAERAKATLEAKANAHAAFASTYVASLGDKLTPVEQNNAKLVLAALLCEDDANPIKDGDKIVSRADVFKSFVEAKGEHGLEKEVIPADAGGKAAEAMAKAGKVLPSAADKEGSATDSDAVVKAALAATSIGRKVLENTK